jgi:hypothetical protein
MISKSIILATVLLASAAAAQAAQIASVTAIQGKVSVVSSSGKVRLLATTPDKIRVVDGGVEVGDEVRTGAGASATVFFPDGSTIRLDESTRLVVSEKPIPGIWYKSIKRMLLLNAGSIDCNVKPDTPVYTSIRTPLGVVGIRGTKLSVSAIGGRFQITVESGKVFVMDTPGRAVFDLGNGQTVQLEVNERQQLVGQVLADGGNPVMATIGNSRVRMESGAIIRVSGIAGERLSVTALAGVVRVTYPAIDKTEDLPVGQTAAVLGPGAPPGLPPPGEETATFSDRGVPDPPGIPIIRDTTEGSPYK